MQRRSDLCFHYPFQNGTERYGLQNNRLQFCNLSGSARIIYYKPDLYKHYWAVTRYSLYTVI